MFKRTLITALSLLAALSAGEVLAGDWPQWRFDAQHTAVSPDELPTDMRLLWVRHFAEPRPAWPRSQSKLQFDAAPQPVVAGQQVFVPSTVNDTVTAYDTASGVEQWRFYADGPVRFAPVASHGRVYFVADDGLLYCLSARDGALQWKLNGGPTVRRVIGNDRLISSWPARGGPVLRDGMVYFTASIWPFMGIFIHAVDADTGNIIWTNSGDGTNYTVQPHGAPSFGTVVPQGYLAATAKHLVVPGGRSLPAVYDRATGKLTNFQFGGKGEGGWDVLASDGFFLVGGRVYDMLKSKPLGATDARILANNMLIGSDGRSVHAHTTDGSIETVASLDARGKQRISTRLATQKFWSFGAAQGATGRVAIVAGSRVYTYNDGDVAAFTMGSGDAANRKAPLWQGAIDGSVASLLAADDKLFVVAQDGSLWCFGQPSLEQQNRNANDKAPVADQPRRHEHTVTPLASQDDAWPAVAKAMLDRAPARQGFAVVMGLGSGRLVEELVRQSKLHVIAIDPDAAKVQAFRRRMDAAGLYGTRVAAHVGDPATFSLPPYMAELVASEDLGAAGVDRGAALAKAVFHVLRPYGGVACLPLSDTQHDSFAAAVAESKLENAQLQRDGAMTMLARPGALPGSADWTHQYGDAAQSGVSKDKRVKAPLGLLWFGGPSNDSILPRHGHGPSPQVAAGRLFIEGPDLLRAVDVYTGRVLWEKDLPGVGQYYDVTRHSTGAGEIGSNYASTDQAVYVIHGSRILELNAATGQTTRQFTADDQGAAAADRQPAWGYVGVWDDLLIATSEPVAVTINRAKVSAYLPMVPVGLWPLVKAGESWQFMLGADPPGDWTALDYDDEKWTRGAGGFGFDDDDDKSAPADAPRLEQRVYIRKTFNVTDLAKIKKLMLGISYDDGFVAYLNGVEVARSHVKGRGAGADVSAHTPKGYEYFAIDGAVKLLRKGRNVLALEGHNAGRTSSEFSLRPFLMGGDGEIDPVAPSVLDLLVGKSASSGPVDPRFPVHGQYGSGSQTLVVFDRKTGRRLWQRRAQFNFRHNNIAVGGGMIFCVDSMTDQKLAVLRRRGVRPTGTSMLYALYARSGNVAWSTDQNVFGTFLNYSGEHDVLLQAGSSYRDRAGDEASTGMIAYRGRSGQVLWENFDDDYGGPCLLWHDKVITNGSGGFAMNLSTGKPTGWKYSRMYGCNTAIGSENLLTFRSGAAGYYDLAGDSGTGNLGGFRSSCTNNLIVADGVLNAPDYTRTCTCGYQNQCSLALVYMPEAEMWTFNGPAPRAASPRTVGINFGAPGDRRAPSGTLWTDYPSVGGRSPDVPVKLEGKFTTFRQHASQIAAGELPWVAASGIAGAGKVTITVNKDARSRKRYTVRLFFAEPQAMKPGQRVFDVSVQGQLVLDDFDIVRQAGGAKRTVVKQFQGVAIEQALTIALKGGGKASPVLCGVEVAPQP